MNYKPTKEELIEYLYGEMDDSRKAVIAQYLNENPEAKKELEGMNDTRLLLGQWEDEEIVSPPGYLQPWANSEWLYWRKYVAVAASILLVITFGWVSQFQVSFGENGFQAGFGTIENGLSADEVADVIEQDRAQMADWMQTQMADLRDSMNNEMRSFQANFGNEETLDALFKSQKDNLTEDMYALSVQLREDYRDIFRQLIVNFSDNVESQRLEDLQNIQAALTSLEEASIEKDIELEDALLNLGEQVNAALQNNNNQ